MRKKKAKKYQFTEAEMKKRIESIERARAVLKQKRDQARRELEKSRQERKATTKRAYNRNPLQASADHYTGIGDLTILDLLTVGSFEREEFEKSGYRESKKRPHQSGNAKGGRPKADPETKKLCLNCDNLFHSKGKFNRLCIPCAGQSDYSDLGFSATFERGPKGRMKGD